MSFWVPVPLEDKYFTLQWDIGALSLGVIIMHYVDTGSLQVWGYGSVFGTV